MSKGDIIGWAVAAFVVFILGAIVAVIIWSFIQTIIKGRRDHAESNRAIRAHEQAKANEREHNGNA